MDNNELRREAAAMAASRSREKEMREAFAAIPALLKSLTTLNDQIGALIREMDDIKRRLAALEQRS